MITAVLNFTRAGDMKNPFGAIDVQSPEMASTQLP